MTINEWIESKIKRAKVVALISWITFVVIAAYDESNELFFYYLIPAIFFFGSAIYIMFFVKCPKCDTNLGQTAMYAGNFFLKKSKLNYCSSCGLDFKIDMH